MKQEDFNKLKDIIEKELTLTESNIHDKSLQISNYYIKFLQIYNKEVKLLKNLYHSKEKKFGDLYHYYKFKYEFQLGTKSEIEVYINSNDEFHDISMEFSNQEIIVKYLEQILDHINNVGYRIKNYIELQKLKQGLL